jgi:sec-independent protein translocase protein TatB
MFGIGMPEMLLILAVALIVIGPKKLPDLAKSLGRALGEFKRATSDLKESIQAETGLDEVRDTLKETKTDLKKTLLADEAPAVGSPATGEKTDAAPPDSAPLSNLQQEFGRLNAADPKTDKVHDKEDDTKPAQPGPQDDTP